MESFRYEWNDGISHLIWGVLTDATDIATGPKMICQDTCIKMAEDEQAIVTSQECTLKFNTYRHETIFTE